MPRPITQSKFEKVWDGVCLFSLIGIWPRFIEPRLLGLSKCAVAIPSLPKELIGFKILQFSDLHWHSQFSPLLLTKLTRKINEQKPDLIVFTGDFLCRSHLEQPELLLHFLQNLQAKVDCFAIMGNHDYNKYVTVKANGDYGIEENLAARPINKGFKRLFNFVPLTKHVSKATQNIGLHNDLVDLLHKTPFKLLDNKTITIPIKGTYLNICGLGEYMAGQCLPKKAFENYKTQYPGLILSHNPDSIKILQHYPGNLILCGHTHGGQVNLPWLWRRLVRIENENYKRGLKKLAPAKWAYINRGIAGMLKFRWCARPEITLITLQNE